jgi:hypothetical protein
MFHSYSYWHPTIIILFVILTLILLTTIQTRFGFELKWQKAWLAILLFALIGAITSSVINYNEMWDRLLVSLQIGSLATIFSGIAALGVITQLTNHPYVFTTPDNSLSSNLACKILQPNIESEVIFDVYNCSKITAHDVIVQANFPKQVKILSINSPIWTFIQKNGNGFEVHFDSDKSYNPVHPNVHPHIPVRMIVSELSRPCAITVTTMAKNMARVNHTFLLATNKDNFEKIHVQKRIKKEKLPMATNREALYNKQKVLSIILILLAIAPFI